MKKLILLAMVIGVILIGCSHTAYIREHPDLLKPGLHASAFLEVWGQPDETMSYLDYQNKQYQYSSGAAWNESRGSYSSHGSIYTPQMLVWVYYKYGKVLFFSRNRIYSPLSIDAIPVYSAYELVGWKNIEKSQNTQLQTEPSASSIRNVLRAPPPFDQIIKLANIYGTTDSKHPNHLFVRKDISSIKVAITTTTESGGTVSFGIGDSVIIFYLKDSSSVRRRYNAKNWVLLEQTNVPMETAIQLAEDFLKFWQTGDIKFAAKFSESSQITTDWKLCSNSIMASVYLNLKSITHPSENIVKGWIRVIYSKEGVREFISKFGNQYGDLSSSQVLGEINCSKKTGHFLSQIYYGSNGQIISQGTGNFPLPNPIGGSITSTEWEPIPPDSVADVLYKEVCRNK